MVRLILKLVLLLSLIACDKNGIDVETGPVEKSPLILLNGASVLEGDNDFSEEMEVAEEPPPVEVHQEVEAQVDVDQEIAIVDTQTEANEEVEENNEFKITLYAVTGFVIKDGFWITLGKGSTGFTTVKIPASVIDDSCAPLVAAAGSNVKVVMTFDSEVKENSGIENQPVFEVNEDQELMCSFK